MNPTTRQTELVTNKFKRGELVKVERYDKLIEEVSQNVKKLFFKPKKDSFFDKRQRIIVPAKALK